jgi:hypothetical protein
MLVDQPHTDDVRAARLARWRWCCEFAPVATFSLRAGDVDVVLAGRRMPGSWPTSALARVVALVVRI